MAAEKSRPQIVGPDQGPEPPFPIRLGGPVIKGFGRGSAELGIPTANLPISGLDVGGHTDLDSGIYYGYAALDLPEHGGRPTVYEMVMSLGYNPVYGNKERSVEVHVMHDFGPGYGFYGVEMRIAVLGFIREESNYVSKEALIEDIRTDIRVTERCLQRAGYSVNAKDGYLLKERTQPPP